MAYLTSILKAILPDEMTHFGLGPSSYTIKNLYICPAQFHINAFMLITAAPAIGVFRASYGLAEPPGSTAKDSPSCLVPNWHWNQGLKTVGPGWVLPPCALFTMRPSQLHVGRTQLGTRVYSPCMWCQFSTRQLGPHCTAGGLSQQWSLNASMATVATAGPCAEQGEAVGWAEGLCRYVGDPLLLNSPPPPQWLYLPGTAPGSEPLLQPCPARICSSMLKQHAGAVGYGAAIEMLSLENLASSCFTACSGSVPCAAFFSVGFFNTKISRYQI